MRAAPDVLARAPLAPLSKLGLAREIVVAYAVARWTLRRQGLRRALESLRAGAGAGAGGAPSSTHDRHLIGHRLGRAVSRTLLALPADSRCLMSSLVLTRLLASRGIESDLVISVSPGEHFAAHAWVEHEGVPLLPADAPRASRLVTL